MTPFRLHLLLVISMLGGCAHAIDEQPLSCYLPSLNQVAYSEVTALDAPSPTAVLKYGDNLLQFGELWLPAAKGERKHPLVIFIHGGCWLNQYDIAHTHALSAALSQSGYAVWSIEYRRSGDEGGGWPGSYEDIKSAVRFTQSLDQHPVDLSKIAIAGHSAGGHLALLAGSELADKFSAVIGLAAIVDLEKYSLGSNSCQSATAGFMGGTALEKPSDYDAANPAKQKLHANSVLIQGDADSIVPVQQALQSTARVSIVAQAGHFDLIHPATAAYQQLLRELAAAFR